MCKKPLTEDALSTHLPGLILGEEAHIVARSEDGPRGRDGDRSDIDGYNNLILLCADDHTRIDTQPDVYPVDFLQKIKKKHESWAAQRPAEPEPICIRRAPGEDDIPLSRLMSGAAVGNLMAGTMMWSFRPLASDGQPEVTDAADSFLTLARDWAKISDTVQDQGFSAVRDARRSLDKGPRGAIETRAACLRASCRTHMTGGVGAPTSFPYAELAIVTDDEVLRYAEEGTTRESEA